ncbi:MAG: 50S ribosomal protein L34e [archaeon]
MPSGRHKSRSLRKITQKASGGRTVVQYKPRKPGKAKCAECSSLLHGVPRERPVRMMNLPKTKKRPERPYGGVLCSKCLRKRIVDSVRK